MHLERFRTWWNAHLTRHVLVAFLLTETSLFVLLVIILITESNQPIGISMFPNQEETQRQENSERERELGLANHSPEKLFPSYAAIRAYEDMNNYVVVYEKGEGACQVVVKDKNNAKDIYCYEVEDHHGSIHVTHAFKRPFYNLPTDKREMTVEHKNDGM